MEIPEILNGIKIDKNNPLGSYLRGLRQLQLLSVEEAVKYYKVSEQTIRSMEQGKTIPHYKTLRKIVNKFGINSTKVGLLRMAAIELKSQK